MATARRGIYATGLAGAMRSDGSGQRTPQLRSDQVKVEGWRPQSMKVPDALRNLVETHDLEGTPGASDGVAAVKKGSEPASTDEMEEP